MSKLPVIGGVVAAVIVAAALVLRANALPAPGATLIAHEWGTFTALQDDDGTALGAINADDEPVPPFVCGTYGVNTLSALSPLSPRWANGGKGFIACHPDVTMRLETPVIYFYSPDKSPAGPVNVRVTFHGGWLTEFYPFAKADAPAQENPPTLYPPLTSATHGSLAWNGVEVGAAGTLFPTDDAVWKAPREVPEAAVVKVPSPDGLATDVRTFPEKFLFYRGVGHLDSPLRAVRDKQNDRLSLFANLTAMHPAGSSAAPRDLRVPAAWLIEIRPSDGFCAFRPVTGPLDLNASTGQALCALPASFSPDEFSAGRLPALRAAMRESLITAGLFPDEAAAMLKTWELSYFKSPGRRLFYVAPRTWVEQVLPLTIDGATITRAMMGRIELVTPAQRDLLTRIATGPCPDLKDFVEAYQTKVYAAWTRRGDPKDLRWSHTTWNPPTLAEMNLPVPGIYQDYLNLGRFRDALVLHEQKIHPTPALAAFIADNQIQAPGPTPLTLSSFLPGHENPR